MWTVPELHREQAGLLRLPTARPPKSIGPATRLPGRPDRKSEAEFSGLWGAEFKQAHENADSEFAKKILATGQITEIVFLQNRSWRSSQ